MSSRSSDWYESATYRLLLHARSIKVDICRDDSECGYKPHFGQTNSQIDSGTMEQISKNLVVGNDVESRDSRKLRWQSIPCRLKSVGHMHERHADASRFVKGRSRLIMSTCIVLERLVWLGCGTASVKT